jgi:hypothetical protein
MVDLYLHSLIRFHGVALNYAQGKLDLTLPFATAVTENSACCLLLHASCLAYSSVLKMEAVPFLRNARKLLPDCTALHPRRRYSCLGLTVIVICAFNILVAFYRGIV